MFGTINKIYHNVYNVCYGYNLSLEQVAINIARQYGGALLYAKSNLSNLWQNSNGTGAVTTTGQPVGLWLDQSFNGELGGELVVNGTFDTGLSGWTVGTDPAQVIPTWNAGGTVTLTRGAGGVNGFLQLLDLSVGKRYVVSYRNVSGGLGVVSLGNVGNTDVYTATAGEVRTVQLTVSAAAQTTHLNFWCNNSSSITIDNISVREVLGYHATQATGANKPVTTTINGNFAISTNGTNQFMTITNPPQITGDFTVVWAGNLGNLSANRFLLSGNVAGRLAIDVRTDTTMRIYDSTASASVSSGVGYLTTDNAVYSIRRKSSGIEFRKNGALFSTVGGTFTFNAVSIMNVFSNSSGLSTLLGNTAELFIDNQALPDSDLLQIERYGAQRLGITL